MHIMTNSPADTSGRPESTDVIDGLHPSARPATLAAKTRKAREQSHIDLQSSDYRAAVEPLRRSVGIHHADAMVLDALSAAFAAAGLDVQIAVTQLGGLATCQIAPGLFVIGIAGGDHQCAALQSLRDAAPGIPILILADDPLVPPTCSRCHWDAVCYSSDGVACVIDIVKRALAGERSRPDIAHRRVRPTAVPAPGIEGLGRLTRRERQILQLVMAGLGTSEIAASVGISVSTARTHVKNVLSKLGAHTRLQLFAKVRELDARDNVG